MVQLLSSEAAAQWNLETPFLLQGFTVSKWEMCLQCKKHMTVCSAHQPTNLGPPLERSQVFVFSSCPCSNQENHLNSSVIGHGECVKFSTTRRNLSGFITVKYLHWKSP